MSDLADLIIKKYQMIEHPEGGYFVETYRSPLKVSTPNGERSASTAIYFLLKKGDKSHFHRLTSDEGWHFYLGDTLRLMEITPSGETKETLIGPNIEKGEVLQYIVPAGHWFASESTGEFSFVGCTVAPGFEFADFEMATSSQMEELFPGLDEVTKSFVLG